ncbi:uncharacterized protein [Venturia canescens]|uniref:uncharacterized protein isoform X2 n=1 Tax=Venturia canescens TaxID=32260 RepID=UPI001C9CBBC8|nr:uncharacterized protein LOC122413167 isoform X2 [Venturia canescens]
MAGTPMNISRPLEKPRSYRGPINSEISMDPRNLDPAYGPAKPTPDHRRNVYNVQTTANYPQVDVSTQVDLHVTSTIHSNWERLATPLYSREDIKEQYCITSRQLDAVERSSSGIFGCLSTRGPSPCAVTSKVSILSACVRSASSDENICDAPYPRKPLQILYQQPYSTYSGRTITTSRYDHTNNDALDKNDDDDDDDWVESSYFRRRPTSFCTASDPKSWLPEDEESSKMEGPRPVLPSAVNCHQSPGINKGPKHVSFARSHTLTSFEIPLSKSPPRATNHNQERLIDSQPTVQGSLPSTFPSGGIHPYPVPAPPEPRVLVLEKAPKRGGMKTQATQTEVPVNFRRAAPVTLSPRTIHRVKMVSQGAQTNGFLNGRKLTKSYSEAGQLGTPLGGGSGTMISSSGGAASADEGGTEHEPLQRTQSEEPPRSPFLVETPPEESPKAIPHYVNIGNKRSVNGEAGPRPSSVSGVRSSETPKKSREIEPPEDQEILIDFKPAPISPDARRAILATLDNEPKLRRPINQLHKTLSDGEIRVERRELVCETGEPSYPHSCKRNYQDPCWNSGATVRPPALFSSTPANLSLLARVSPPHPDVQARPERRQRRHHEEEFHENIIRRGLFRKRSISLEDGVQDFQSNDFILPRSLPTSPTSPTASPGQPSIVHSSPKYERIRPSFLRTSAIVVAAPSSPFASSDSLTNDATKDHSDGIWNESQATVLQVDSLGLLTPSSRRRHLLLLQHQQRSSMDTEALDAEEDDDMDSVPPASPRIRLEPASPVIRAPTGIDGSMLTSHVTNGTPRGRSGLRRPSPSFAPQPLSQSSSDLGLNLARADSGGRTNTDLSEASTTEDYVTANTSTGTGTTTGASAGTSSWSRLGYLPSNAATSGPASTTATAADGSSFESASSIYSLARSEAVIEEPSSPPPIIEEFPPICDVEMSLEHEEPAPSPARSRSSSSSGSYDLEDAMPEAVPGQNEAYQAPATLSRHGSDLELDHDDGHHSSSGGYAESPPDPQSWTEEERRRRKKTFILDFSSGQDMEEKDNEPRSIGQQPTVQVGLPECVDVSPTPSHRHRPARGKLNAARSPHRNNKMRRDTTQVQITGRSPGSGGQKDDWISSAVDDAVQVPTSDDSSCSHHYHMHHHHHHVHGQQQESGRHRRTRESPRRKTGGGGYATTGRRRSNEDKNAAITGSLPRRRSRAPIDDCSSSRLSPGGRYQRSPGHNGHSAASIIIKSPSPEARLKALSAESLRSVSPGSDSVFYSETADVSGAALTTLIDAPHCQNCGREVSEEIVQPPAGFADSPEGPRPVSSASTNKHVSHRLYKKFDKRYRSEERGEKRYHSRSNGAGGRADIRAKSEERAGRSSSRGSIDDCSRRRFHARSTEASMEVLTGREDEDTYMEPYTGCEWIYISELEESHVWRRPDSRDGDDESSDAAVKDQSRRGSQGSTESEKCFRKKYQAATHRMVHRKSSGEMYKRIQTKSFESDKRVVVRREPGGEFGFRIHGSKPVVVSSIEPDTPAESSGLEVGDIIMSVNGRSVMDATHSEVVRLAHSGPDILELEVARTCNVLAPKVSVNNNGGGGGGGGGVGISGVNGGVKSGAKESAICSGYLWRKATSAASVTPEKWVRRWFALRRDNCLYYYKTDTDSQPVGAVMLLKYEVEQTPGASRPYSFVIKKQGAPSHELAADNEESAARWSTVIREAVERNNQADTWLDASLRMQEVAACAIQRPDCFGYLSKQQKRARKTSSPTGWSRRYCVLKDAALYFYDDANAEKAFGVACLHGFRVHGSAPNSGGRKHAFELQPPDPTQRSYTFATETEMDKKRWLAALEYSIDRWIKVG